ncbi:uncharacterized protein MEPE_01953 [Melanopsichium pennsylvanicum]|uniref:DUF605-domain-containing protein n=2 Tax=Melanopsichium pennsylvanicum TaxID=63383 RepID=A0AAJ4XJQ0_9BASI|nr:conserved hypothetical protein [Melanopsichium pennsylvanicum 4]SNX83247.1 uncharacterized protein MEPE_01953 [Melanopsichium pennsylvanicum]
MDEPLPTPPPELKAVLPYVQRANELRTADRVIAYWCCYYAAQLGISGNAKETEPKMYLLTLMDTLEDLKSKLADNDAVINDAASSAYVENFALKVFVGADNEDRAGKATRATAKKFLAATHFIELLKIFGTLEPEMQEKIKYAKWKAADIAKAFKEGRKPQPGPAGGDPKLEAANLEAAMAPSAVDSKEEQEYLAREMARLTAAEPDEASYPNDIAARHDLTPPPSPHKMSRVNSSHAALPVPPTTAPITETDPLGTASLDAEEMWKSKPAAPTEDMSHSPSKQRSSLDRPHIQPSSSFTSDLASSPSSRPLPVPPQRDGLPIPPISAHHQLSGSSPGLDKPHSGPGAAPASFWGAPTAKVSGFDDSTAPIDSVLPSVPSDNPPSHGNLGGPTDSHHPAIERIDPPRSPSVPSLPSTPSVQPPATYARPFVPSAPAVSAPSAPAMPPKVTAVAAVVVTHPESLDAKLSSRVQKLAKGAASAVDFEDLETARIQLRQALDILEGRTTC